MQRSRALLLTVLLVACHWVGATDSRSLDDNPWRGYIMKLDVPLSWHGARWAAERVDHVLDILAGLDECSCEKARAILETDLRNAQRALELELNAIQEAEAKGKFVNEWITLADQKPSRALASEAQERASRYWSSRKSGLEGAAQTR